MQINRQTEKEIDLLDLFFELLYHWRSILVAALIGAIALGVFQYVRINNIHKAGKQTKEEKQYEVDLENYKESLSTTRMNIRTYTKLIKEKNDYLNESVYMSLDSQAEWVSYRRYFIRMDQAVLDALPQGLQEDPADYVASVYTSTLKSGLDAEEMEELMGTGKKEYIDELVGAGSDAAANTITLSVVGDSRETVEKQMDYFDNRLMTVSAPMAQEVGAHTLTLVYTDTLQRTDGGLSSKQDEINQQIVEWQEALKEQREALNELEEDDAEPKAPGTHVIRYTAIGFILGVLLLAVIYAVRYVMGGKLHMGSELTTSYNLPVFGEFSKSRAKHSGKGLDKLFEKWEFGRKKTDPARIEDNIAALLKEKYSGSRVLLTGTVSGDRLRELEQQLLTRLDGSVSLETQGDFLANTVAVAAAGSADAVVLVEEKYVSDTRNIQRMAEMLVIGSVNVAGCVVI